MIYWLQEATEAGMQGAASFWPSAILSGGLVGAIIGLFGVLIAQSLQQRRHSQTLQQTAAAHAQTEQRHTETLLRTAELEAQRAHEAALQKYLEQVGKLLVDHPLHEVTPEDKLSTVVRAQTLTILETLDRDHKRIVQFLYESNLINADKAVFSVTGANLMKANLAGANLTGANLQRSYLFRADLAGANLAGANLAMANLAMANLGGTGESLTQEQINEANGDEDTKLPVHLQRPAHWSKGGQR
jgi:uncharacterized protein YjbI with pentapeptide repeats